jgi:hypothetical protein
MGAAAAKQFQSKTEELRIKRTAVVGAALQLYQKKHSDKLIGVENGVYDPVLFKKVAIVAIKEYRYAIMLILFRENLKDMSEYISVYIYI